MAAGNLRQRDGIWQMRWYVRGTQYERSCHTTSKAVAQKMLLREIRKSGTGHVPTEDDLTFEGLIEKVRLDREVRGRRCNDLPQRMGWLRPFFADMRAVDITTERVEQYVTARLRDQAAHATINRELALLRRAFMLAELTRKPRIQLLPENNARRDFLDWADFQTVRAELPEWARDVVTFMYLSSWRSGQVVAIEWRDVNMRDRIVTARGETTKTGEPHQLALVGDLWEIVERAAAGRRLDCPYIFHRDGQRHLQGGGKSPLRRAWAAACARTGFAGHVLHCLRRSGVRNMIGAGVDPMLAMHVSGHKTMSMLSRYRIVDLCDQRRALEKTFEFVSAGPTTSKIAVIGRKAEG